MSTPDGPRKKHRHDLGQEDHGPVMSAGTTRGIQAVLGLWVILTFLAVLWAMIDVGRGPERPPQADLAAPGHP